MRKPCTAGPKNTHSYHSSRYPYILQYEVYGFREAPKLDVKAMNGTRGSRQSIGAYTGVQSREGVLEV